jgi:hypothetical protein
MMTAVRIVMTEPPAAHPLMTRILLDHALELSKAPGNEAVFIVAHGPIHDEDNQEQLEVMTAQKNYGRIGGWQTGIDRRRPVGRTQYPMENRT